MASKNNEQDVLDTFAAHPEMPLQLPSLHLVAIELATESRKTSCHCRMNSDSGWIASSSSTTNPRNAPSSRALCRQVLTLALPEEIDRAPEVL